VGEWGNMNYFDWTRKRRNYLIGQDNKVAREKEGCGREKKGCGRERLR